MAGETVSAPETEKKPEPPKTEPPREDLERGVIVYTPPGAASPIRLTVGIVRRYFCPEATELDALAFAGFCRYTGLNPFTNEAYLTVIDNKAQIIVAYTSFMKRAERTRAYRGFQAGVVLMPSSPDAPKFEPEVVDGVVPPFMALRGTLIPSGYEIVGGWCRVGRNDRDEPTTAVVSMREYRRHRRDGKVMRMWDDEDGMPATMIRKTAVAHAHRDAFPNELAGFYLDTEFPVGERRFDRPVTVDAEAPVVVTPVPPEVMALLQRLPWTDGQREMFLAEARRLKRTPEDVVQTLKGLLAGQPTAASAQPPGVPTPDEVDETQLRLLQ
jgi:phage recombination protein Bet